MLPNEVARRLLDDPAFPLAVEAARASIAAAWMAAKTIEDREALHYEMRALSRIENRIAKMANS